MAHWAQLVRSGKFQKYDFGLLGNLKNYGSMSPPSWDLSQIATPTVLFTGGQDILADPYDVELLRQALNPDYLVYQETFPDYDHLDFSWGMDAHARCYPKLAELLNKYAQVTVE
jgi:lysosomal acid lipase/cholesteryl ester hydrolase